MKKRIAETGRKVGIDEEDMHADKAFAVSFLPPHVYRLANSLSQREPPPKIEWWDQGLTTASISNTWSFPPTRTTCAANETIPLTKKKVTESLRPTPRHQPRAEALKEMEAKVHLDLEPPPQPMIKKSNLMRVLSEEVVKDPTAVEARVSREIKEPHEGNLKVIEKHKLTKNDARKNWLRTRRMT